MNNYDYVVVGAGLFGSVFAYKAKQAGKKALVIDRRGHIGGNCYTENREGINVHVYGAHIFHTSKKHVWDFINQFAEFNNFINSPVAVYKDELYNLPFNMNTFSKMWGIKTPKEAMEIIESQKASLGIDSPKNLEEQALSLVGKDVYEKLIKGYTEKQWGRPCKDLPAFIIKRLPLRFTYDNNYFTDRYQGIPIGGYTQIFEKLLSGVDVKLGTDWATEGRLIDGGTIEGGPTVIYTGPIDEYFGYRLGHLSYRSLRFETETIQVDNYQGNAVVNFTAADVPYTRIIEHKHFEKLSERTVPGDNFDRSIVTREYPDEWSPGKEPYYPVNDEANSRLYAEYKALADKEPNVYFGGRLGTYSYYDMDRVIELALGFAEELLG